MSGVADETRQNHRTEKSTVATVPSDTLAQPRRVVAGGILWRKALAAFQHRNYQLFFTGQLISLVGTWMQTVAEGWLVYELTNSPFALGLIRFLHTIPVTLLSLFAGVVADRMAKRSILLTTQSASMLFALAMGLLVYFEVIQLWHIAVLGLCLGTAHAFDIPARQSFVVELVGKSDLMNAIALNSSMFNGARMIGPALAGMLIGGIGIAGCFFINSISFLAVIASYLAMRLPKFTAPTGQPSIRQATVDALRYVIHHRVLRAILGLVIVVSLFGWPYSVLMPVIARDVLNVGASGYGFLMGANGVGAFLGAATLASLGNYPYKRRLVFTGVVGFSCALFVFSMSRNVWVSAAALSALGWFMIVFFATANTLVQLTVPDELRGRVMGIYSLCFIGTSPLGSLMAGAVARFTSAPFAIGLGAVVCVLAALATYRLIPFKKE